jgi:hypothetical protein
MSKARVRDTVKRAISELRQAVEVLEKAEEDRRLHSDFTWDHYTKRVTGAREWAKEAVRRLELAEWEAKTIP